MAEAKATADLMKTNARETATRVRERATPSRAKRGAEVPPPPGAPPVGASPAPGPGAPATGPSSDTGAREP
jgi:hypothetical protein